MPTALLRRVVVLFNPGICHRQPYGAFRGQKRYNNLKCRRHDSFDIRAESDPVDCQGTKGYGPCLRHFLREGVLLNPGINSGAMIFVVPTALKIEMLFHNFQFFPLLMQTCTIAIHIIQTQKPKCRRHAPYPNRGIYSAVDRHLETKSAIGTIHNLLSPN